MPWLIGVGAILAASCTPASLGQILVDLTIEGLATVLENTETQYAATAHFDDGSEFDVTILCDWSVKPETYASIDTFGRLTTLEVSQDQAIVIWASFTWRDVTLDDCLNVTIIDVTKDPEGDPWPEYQRTASRLGRTSTIGPQTPTIAWSIQFDFSGFTSAFGGSTVMDSVGRIFVPAKEGLTCIDSVNREILWQFLFLDSINTAPTIWNGRVLFGSPNDMFYCVDAATGEEIWSVPALPHPNRGQVVDDSLPGGVVYYPSESDVLYARLIDDGSEVWTVPSAEAIVSPPSLDALGRLFVTSAGDGDVRAHVTSNGDTHWSTPIGTAQGHAPVENGRVYATAIGSLYCLDAVTGEVIWEFENGETNSAAPAIGHDGTVYFADACCQKSLFAVSPDGVELWTYSLNGQVKYPPIVDGKGTIYICAFNIEAGAFGEVHAVNPDGTRLWVKEMPDEGASLAYVGPGRDVVRCLPR